MNIALFADSYFPTKSGVVTVVTQLKEQLIKMNHNVVLVCPQTTKEYTSKEPDMYQVKSFSLGLGTDQFVAIPNRLALLRFMKSKNINIIHCHTEFGIGLSAAYIAKKLHIPAICTIHTMWVDFYKYYLKHLWFITPKIVNTVMSGFYKKFDALIGVSSKARNYYKRPNMVGNIPVVVIPNSIDTEKFKSSSITKKDSEKERKNLRKKHGIKNNEVLFMFLGRIAEEKRVFELAEQCKKLVAMNPKAKVMFVGKGPAFNELCAETKEFADKGKIIFTGFVEWTETHKYYEAADVFITASLSEMHSMTILEAELCGLPIAARMDESFLDCVFPGKNGYLAESDDELLKNMLEISFDKEKRKSFGEQSLEVTKNFTIKSHVKKTILMYEEVIKSYPEKINESEVIKKIEEIH